MASGLLYETWHEINLEVYVLNLKGGGIQNLYKILGGGYAYSGQNFRGGIKIFVCGKSKSPGPPLVINTEPSLITMYNLLSLNNLSKSSQHYGGLLITL